METQKEIERDREDTWGEVHDLSRERHLDRQIRETERQHGRETERFSEWKERH